MGKNTDLGQGQRLIVVSNRLPVTIKRGEDGQWNFSMSSGGLVSALSGCKKQMDFTWIGWPGVDVPESEREAMSKRLMEEYSCLPVFVNDEVADRHYNGFSNSILWPLFHYHPGEMMFDETNWLAYREVNLLFAEAVRKEVKAGDIVWVQDYHLMQTMPNGVLFDGRYAHVGTFPIGIDPDQFINAIDKPAVTQRVAELKQRFKGVQVVVGIDRLDYIKGVPQKLHALESFLNDHPEMVGKVVLVQVAVPSRGDVEEYQNLRASVNELVGRINGRFGTVEFMPIHFMHRSIPFNEMCALYAVADACLVSSTRDGMNLVAYEYIACQRKNHGSLILSEFAGAAHSLNGSIIVNPWNTDELSNSIYQAMSMDEESRKSNHDKLFGYVTKYTASAWGTAFIKELVKIKKDEDSRLQAVDAKQQ